MASEVWSLALPVGGLPLKKLSVIGSGNDPQMRVVRDGWPLLVLSLNGVRSTVAEDVVLEFSSVDEVSIELSYEAPELVLSQLHIRWDEDVMPGVEEELEALFGGAVKGGIRRQALTSCVDVEFRLTTQNTKPEQVV